MSIKNAPPKWHQITSYAKGLGAKDEAMKKWLQRGIPERWQIKIFQASGGGITWADMAIKGKNK